MANIINVTNDNYEQEIERSDIPVLIDFWASWCNPCRMLSPVIDEIAQERDDIKICKIDVDAEMELAGVYGIMSIPTLILVKNGKPVNKIVGARPKTVILEMIDSSK